MDIYIPHEIVSIIISYISSKETLLYLMLACKDLYKNIQTGMYECNIIWGVDMAKKVMPKYIQKIYCQHCDFISFDIYRGVYGCSTHGRSYCRYLCKIDNSINTIYKERVNELFIKKKRLSKMYNNPWIYEYGVRRTKLPILLNIYNLQLYLIILDTNKNKYSSILEQASILEILCHDYPSINVNNKIICYDMLYVDNIDLVKSYNILSTGNYIVIPNNKVVLRFNNIQKKIHNLIVSIRGDLYDNPCEYNDHSFIWNEKMDFNSYEFVTRAIYGSVVIQLFIENVGYFPNEYMNSNINIYSYSIDGNRCQSQNKDRYISGIIYKDNKDRYTIHKEYIDYHIVMPKYTISEMIANLPFSFLRACINDRGRLYLYPSFIKCLYTGICDTPIINKRQEIRTLNYAYKYLRRGFGFKFDKKTIDRFIMILKDNKYKSYKIIKE